MKDRKERAKEVIQSVKEKDGKNFRVKIDLHLLELWLENLERNSNVLRVKKVE
jgi:hypothetical protein